MKRIAVIGESCKDIFIYCSATRLAPDLPVPVLQIDSQSQNPGMAANVYRNILATGLEADLITNPNWEEISKTRFMHNQTNHMFIRVDTPHEISPAVKIPSLASYAAVVIADYNKGYLSENLIQNICNSHPLVFLDTKKPLNTWASHATYIKINDYEYKRSIPTMTPAIQEKVIHTIGGGGAIYQGERFPVEQVDVIDSSGAGDAFMASLVYHYLNSQDIKASIQSANRSAARVVAKRGVSIIGN